MSLYTGFNYVTREKVVDIGDIEITADKNHTASWSPFIGIGVMVIGGVVFLYGKKKWYMPIWLVFKKIKYFKTKSISLNYWKFFAVNINAYISGLSTSLQSTTIKTFTFYVF